MGLLSPSGRSFLMSIGVGFVTFAAAASGSRLLLGHSWPAAVVGAAVATIVAQSATFVLCMRWFNQSPPSSTGAEGLVGATGTVVRPVEPEGLVRVHGETWSALSSDGRSLASGIRARVIAVEDLILIVEDSNG